MHVSFSSISHTIVETTLYYSNFPKNNCCCQSEESNEILMSIFNQKSYKINDESTSFLSFWRRNQCKRSNNIMNKVNGCSWCFIARWLLLLYSICCLWDAKRKDYCSPLNNDENIDRSSIFFGLGKTFILFPLFKKMMILMINQSSSESWVN
jgi:hypothetical protein